MSTMSHNQPSQPSIDRKKLDHSINDYLKDHKLVTVFNSGYVEHRTSYSDRARDIRRKEKIEQWEPQSEIGRGGFGLVELQKERVTGRLRVVKEVRRYPNQIIDPLREVVAMAALSRNRSNFVELYGWFENERQTKVFIAMEYFELGDVQACVNAPLPEPECQRIIFQVTEALEFMHDRNIAHRDLKPMNIFVVRAGPKWWIKVADLGISKRHSDFTALRTTLSADSEFAAPEMMKLTENSPMTNMVDMWSVGSLATWLFLHELLVKGRRKFEILWLGLPMPFERLSWAGLSPVGVDFVSSLLVVKANQRLSSALALKHPWLNSLASLDDSSSSDSEQTPATNLNLELKGSDAAGFDAIDSSNIFNSPRSSSALADLVSQAKQSESSVLTKNQKKRKQRKTAKERKRQLSAGLGEIESPNESLLTRDRDTSERSLQVLETYEKTPLTATENPVQATSIGRAIRSIPFRSNDEVKDNTKDLIQTELSLYPPMPTPQPHERFPIEDFYSNYLDSIRLKHQHTKGLAKNEGLAPVLQSYPCTETDFELPTNRGPVYPKETMSMYEYAQPQRRVSITSPPDFLRPAKKSSAIVIKNENGEILSFNKPRMPHEQFPQAAETNIRSPITAESKSTSEKTTTKVQSVERSRLHKKEHILLMDSRLRDNRLGRHPKSIDQSSKSSDGDEINIDPRMAVPYRIKKEFQDKIAALLAGRPTGT